MKRKIYIIYAFLGMTFTGCDNILDSTPAVTNIVFTTDYYSIFYR